MEILSARFRSTGQIASSIPDPAAISDAPVTSARIVKQRLDMPALPQRTSAKRLTACGTSWAIRMPLLLALAAAFLFTAAAQVDEYRLKAAFLYNFTKFVDWPSEAPRRPDEPIAICVLGRNPFGNVLSETIAGKVVGLRTLTVREVSDSKQVDGCSILFVSASADKQFRSIAKTLSGAAILSVGQT